jgi:cysteine-S-conjugate beta-lyase
MKKTDDLPQKPDTLVTTVGRDPASHFNTVNPPIHRASTVTFPTVADLEAVGKAPFDIFSYGRQGTPTTFHLEEAMAKLEGGHRGIVCSSGVSAIAVALTAFLQQGDHVLMVDSTYDPTRRYCDQLLARFGVETTYYDPLVGADIAKLIRPNTKVVFVESPGSITFEVQDIPAIAEAAHKAGAVVLMDNSWATPLLYRALDHGVDVAIYSGTKYLVGHADAMIGIIVTTQESFLKVRRSRQLFGPCAGPDDCYLTLRGLRTLGVRLERHQKTGMLLAEWLQKRPEVARLLHPAFPGCPGHDIWKRDFKGASGLFSIILKPTPKQAVTAMLDGMKLFAMGYSWGGFESLILPLNPASFRTAVPWQAEGPLLRLHAGLEDPSDLIADLEEGFARLKAAS